MRSRPTCGSGGSRQALDRIASALDLPASAFFNAVPEAVATPAGRMTRARQLLLLVELFGRVEDPVLREECVEFVRVRAKS